MTKERLEREVLGWLGEIGDAHCTDRIWPRMATLQNAKITDKFSSPTASAGPLPEADHENPLRKGCRGVFLLAPDLSPWGHP